MSKLANLNALNLASNSNDEVIDLSPLRNLTKLEYLDFYGNKMDNLIVIKELENKGVYVDYFGK